MKKKKQKQRDPIKAFNTAVKKINRSKNPPDTIALRKPRDYRDDYDKAIRAFNIVRKERDAAIKALADGIRSAHNQGYHDGWQDAVAQSRKRIDFTTKPALCPKCHRSDAMVNGICHHTHILDAPRKKNAKAKKQ